MSELISYRGDLAPGNLWLLGEQLGVNAFDGFSDFDESNADRIKYQSVGEWATE